MLDRDGYLERWAALHGGYDARASALVGGWLRLTYVLARPLAGAGVSPHALTGLGVLLAGLAAGCAWAGGRWLLVAALLVAASGVLDGLDGAVAVLRGRATRWGFVLDSVADRVGDALYAVVLWLAGAPGEVAAAGAALALLQEYARARAGAAGLAEIGVVTVWERPTRVIVTVAFLAATGAFLDERWAGLGAWLWVGLGVVGLTQLLFALHGRLR